MLKNRVTFRVQLAIKQVVIMLCDQGKRDVDVDLQHLTKTRSVTCTLAKESFGVKLKFCLNY
jgi:hypothetical protein